jgi:PKD repeat protein
VIEIGDVVLIDAGVLESHEAVIDWGDGTTEDLGEVDSPIEGLHHTYEERGEYTVTVRVVDADDEESFGEDTLTITVYDVGIELSAGWNLFSVPLVSLGDAVDIEDVLSGISDNVVSVWSYQGGEWLYYRGEEGDTLDVIVPGYGYYIEMANDDILFQNGEKMFNSGENEQPPSVMVTPGWNLIGHYGTRTDVLRDDALETLEGTYATVLNGNGFSVTADNELLPEEGYWLFLKGTEELEYAPSEAAYAED